MNEQIIQKRIIDYLTICGYWVVKIITCNKTGCMDVIACAPGGKFVGIEVKYDRNTPSDLQLLVIKEILAKGGVAFVAWSLDEVVIYLSYYGLPNAPLKLCGANGPRTWSPTAPAYRTEALLARLTDSAAAERSPHRKL